jgi:hypothetical protein
MKLNVCPGDLCMAQSRLEIRSQPTAYVDGAWTIDFIPFEHLFTVLGMTDKELNGPYEHVWLYVMSVKKTKGVQFGWMFLRTDILLDASLSVIVGWRNKDECQVQL